MSNFKRNFTTLQDGNHSSIDFPSTCKKTKLSYEHPLKLFARLRPTPNDGEVINSESQETLQIDFEDSSVTINRPDDTSAAKESYANNKFSFSQILSPQATHEQVMRGVTLPVLEDLLNYELKDKSGVIFLYGLTSAERLSSLLGNPSDAGLLPRTMKTLLDLRSRVQKSESEMLEDLKPSFIFKSNGEKVVEFKIFFEAFEIYNEEIYDLLKDSRKDKIMGFQGKQKLQMKDKDSQRSFIKDLTVMELTSDQQAAESLARIKSKVEEDETLFPGKSVRAHNVFRLIVKRAVRLPANTNSTTPNKGANKSYTTASLCIVQLAGTERTKKFVGTESQYKSDIGLITTINKSLNVLAKCLKDLKELREGQNTHTTGNTWNSTNLVKPPLYKESKLTRALYEYFYDDSNLRLVTYLDENPAEIEETMKILNYVGQLKNNSVMSSSRIPSVSKINMGGSVKKTLVFAENRSNHKTVSDKLPQANYQDIGNMSVSKDITIQTQEIMSNSQNLNESSMEEKNVKTAMESEFIDQSTQDTESQILNDVRPEVKDDLVMRAPSRTPAKIDLQDNLKQKLNSSKKVIDLTQLPDQVPDEKDLKIQVLEGLLGKLQERMCYKEMTEKLQFVNENFRDSLRGLMKPENEIAKTEFKTFTTSFWPAQFKINSDMKSDSMEPQPSVPFVDSNSSFSMPPPVNVNYFVFHGGLENERFNELENLLKAHANNSVHQNNIFIIENQKNDDLFSTGKPSIEKARGYLKDESHFNENVQEVYEDFNRSKRGNKKQSRNGRKGKQRKSVGKAQLHYNDDCSTIQIKDEDITWDNTKIEIENEGNIYIKKEFNNEENFTILSVEESLALQEDSKPIALRTRGRTKEQKMVKIEN